MRFERRTHQCLDRQRDYPLNLVERPDYKAFEGFETVAG